MDKSIILVGGTNLKAYLDNNCFDDFNVVKTYFGMSPLSLGETKRVKNIPKERLTLPVRFDANNDFNGFLSKNQSDFIFLDFQKALANVICIDGHFYTDRPNEDDDFYKLNREHVIAIDGKNPEKYFDKLDSLADIILKHYTPKNTVLISSFVPSYYTVGKYVRSHKNKFAYNNFFLTLEKHFAEKTGCIYYDKSKYFYNEKRAGAPTKYAVFESCFYDMAKSDFEGIVSGKKTSPLPDYKVYVERYAALQSTLDKKCFGVFLDKSDNTDRFLMACPPKFCLDNKINFARLKSSASSGKLFGAKPSIKFSGIYREFLKAEKKNPAALKHPERIFDNNISVKHLLNEIRSASDVEHKKQITYKNYGQYYYTVFKKSSAEITPPHVVDVIGTCISRFVFNFNENDFVVNNFAFHFVPIMTDVKANYENGLFDESKWEEKILKMQCDCCIKDFLGKNKAEWLVMDLFTLTALTAFSIGGKPVCMMGRSFAKRNGFESIEISKTYSDEFIVSELKKFAETLRSMYGDNIILIKSRRQIKKVDDTDKIVPYTNPVANGERNRKNDIYTEAFCKYSGCWLVDISDQFLSDDRSFVTLSPAHFEEECYLEEGKIIKNIIENKPKQKRFSDYSADVRLARILRFIKAGNSADELEELFHGKKPDSFVVRMSAEDIEKNYDFILSMYNKSYKTDEEFEADIKKIKINTSQNTTE